MIRCARGFPGGCSFSSDAGIRFRKRHYAGRRRRLGLGVALIAAGVLLLLLCVPEYLLVFGASAALILIGKCLL